jgi:hypothetical protein
MKTNTTHEALYLGMASGEITCTKHAGHTLRSSIENAKTNQTKYKGLNGEFYVLTTEKEIGMNCEYC